jgi:hypothetical protein
MQEKRCEKRHSSNDYQYDSDSSNHAGFRTFCDTIADFSERITVDVGAQLRKAFPVENGTYTCRYKESADEHARPHYIHPVNPLKIANCGKCKPYIFHVLRRVALAVQLEPESAYQDGPWWDYFFPQGGTIGP